jgi:hypothetical protein
MISRKAWGAPGLAAGGLGNMLSVQADAAVFHYAPAASAA